MPISNGFGAYPLSYPATNRKRLAQAQAQANTRDPQVKYYIIHFRVTMRTVPMTPVISRKIGGARKGEY